MIASNLTVVPGYAFSKAGPYCLRKTESTMSVRLVSTVMVPLTLPFSASVPADPPPPEQAVSPAASASAPTPARTRRIFMSAP